MRNKLAGLLLIVFAESAYCQVTLEIVVPKKIIELGEPLEAELVINNQTTSTVLIFPGHPACPSNMISVTHGDTETKGIVYGFGVEGCGRRELKSGEQKALVKYQLFVDFQASRNGELLFPEQGSYALRAASGYETEGGNKIPVEAAPVIIMVDPPRTSEQRRLWELLQSDRRVARLAGDGPLVESAMPYEESEAVSSSLLQELDKATQHLSQSSPLRRRLAESTEVVERNRQIRSKQEQESK